MTSRVERAFWLAAPILIAGLAHVAVIVLDLASGLARPIDAGRRWRGKEILGRNKTWRGFVVMPAGTAVTVAAQQALASKSRYLAALVPLAPGTPQPWMVGAVCGAAYVIAELPNSFVKRRLGIAPGRTGRRTAAVQYAIDQLDSVLGCAVAIRVFYRISHTDAFAAGILGGVLHIAVERGMRVLIRNRRAPA